MSLRELAKRRIPYPAKQGFEYIYDLIPLRIPPRILYGKVFWDTYRLLQESQWWSREKLEEYQMRQLEKLLKHAYTHVPYYRNVFYERGLKPKDIQRKEDLIKLPILTKEIIRNNLHDLLAQNAPKKEFFLVKTSGSTASPLSFFWHKKMTISKEEAFIWTIYNIAGYKFNEKRLELTWERSNDRLWRYNPIERVLKLSAFTLNEEILRSYLNLINKFRPKVLKSIPSNLVVLADFVQKKKISTPASIKIILSVSEMVYPWQRQLIEQVFKCRLFTFYGQNERVALATECEVSSAYHIFPEYGITEIIGCDDLPVRNDGAKGRIIGTGFSNYAMPFIRYETGDIGLLSDKRCTCGRNYPLLKSIEGRENEYLVSKSGHLIPITSVSYSSIMKNVKQFQFYQDTKGKILLKLVPLPHFTRDDAREILNDLKSEIKDIDVKIEYTDIIHRTERGKYKYIIQKLPIKFVALSG